MKKKILWVVTARSGSKSIIHKNIKPLGGQPLLSYRIISACESNFSHDIWISTDSKDYASIARSFGAEVPFIRPENLSSDNSSSFDVILHAMYHAEKLNKQYDYIGMLEPTSPFITSVQLDEAISLLDKSPQAKSIVAVKESRPNTIFIQEASRYLNKVAENLQNLENLTRQVFTKEITPSGGFYISQWDAFLRDKTFYTERTLGYEVDPISGLEIDEPIDWDFAEFIISRRLNNE